MISSVHAMKDIRAGEEVFVHYGYPAKRTPELDKYFSWYYDIVEEEEKMKADEQSRRKKKRSKKKNQKPNNKGSSQ